MNKCRGSDEIGSDFAHLRHDPIWNEKVFAAHAILPVSFELRDALVADLRTVVRVLTYSEPAGFKNEILCLTRWADAIAARRGA